VTGNLAYVANQGWPRDGAALNTERNQSLVANLRGAGSVAHRALRPSSGRTTAYLPTEQAGHCGERGQSGRPGHTRKSEGPAKQCGRSGFGDLGLCGRRRGRRGREWTSSNPTSPTLPTPIRRRLLSRGFIFRDRSLRGFGFRRGGRAGCQQSDVADARALFRPGEERRFQITTQRGLLYRGQRRRTLDWRVWQAARRAFRPDLKRREHNGTIESGDHVVLTLDHSANKPCSVAGHHFFLPVAGDSLGGTGSLRAARNSQRQMDITLGQGAKCGRQESSRWPQRTANSRLELNLHKLRPNAVVSLEGIPPLTAVWSAWMIRHRRRINLVSASRPIVKRRGDHGGQSPTPPIASIG